MQDYQKLEKTFARLSHLGHLGAMAGWDRSVMMPDGGSQARADAMAELSVIATEILQNPQLDELFQTAESEIASLDPWQKANFQEMKRSWLQATAVKIDLVEAKSLAGAKCEQAWRKLRGENNWTELKPLLEEVINLTREESKQRAQATGLDPYDALMDQYEPGLRRKSLGPLFARLKKDLPSFVEKIVERQKSETIVTSTGPFPIAKQRELGVEMMAKVGFDFQHGRLDVSHHPFCGGVPSDVRLTTRYQEGDFTTSFMGVMHETGHARYEQGLPRKWGSQPVGCARGMGLHESQSLLFEMQIGRSQEFLDFAAPLMKKHLQSPTVNEEFWQSDNLYKLYTRVQPSYIRVDADEATYPLHVVLRYEIECALIDGSLKVADLPDAWDEKMQTLLGLSTKGNFKNGCMQDIHWMDGAIGYFPTYTLGAMNAAQIFAKIQKDIPPVKDQIRAGNFAQISEWLNAKIWAKGSSMSIDELMTSATGESLNSEYFLNYLNKKYLS
jgi:carboxypeptidase Taq